MRFRDASLGEKQPAAHAGCGRRGISRYYIEHWLTLLMLPLLIQALSDPGILANPHKRYFFTNSTDIQGITTGNSYILQEKIL